MRALVPLLCFGMAACSTGSQSPTIPAMLTGASMQEFILRNGVPQVQQKLPDGTTMMEWTDTHGVADTGGLIQQLVGAAGEVEVQGGSYQLVCRLRFIVTKDGKIASVAVVKDTPGRRGLSRCAEVSR